MKLRLLFLTFLFSAFSWGQTTVSYDFSAGGAVDGFNQAAPGIALDANIGFGSFRNSSATNPAIFSGQLRLYQNATKGGSIVIYASNGVTITEVRVFASGTTGPAAFSVDGGIATNMTAGTTYTMSGLSATSEVEFYQRDSDKNNRIYVDRFEVTYITPTTPPTITSSLTASGNQGAAFSYDITATNSPTSYSATGLPAGLSINTATGEITGTVGTAGVYNIDITATNAYGSDTQTLVVTIVVGPCGSESFTNSNATASYANNSFVGDNGVTWTYIQSRDENGDANGSGISGKALMLRRLSDNSRVTSSSVGTGIQDFSVTLYKGFTGEGNRQVELFVNGISQGTSTPFDDYNAHVFTVNNINISGNVVIEIRNITGSQVIVDDISWTCYNIDNEIDVEGNSVSIVNGDTTPSTTDDTDFGTTIVGNDVSHTFTITNAGPDDLDISGITITGVDAADFYVSINPGSVVGAGGSTTFEVTFSPSAAGTSNATINIANNDSDENPYTFDIVAVSTLCTPTTSISSITPTSGPIGTVVTINGTGFTTAASVSFSGVAASFTIISNTVIEAIVPTITASGNIVIQDAGGCNLSYSSYTLIAEDNSSCEGIAVTTDLIIYDLHDEYTGDGGFITIYNGTASTVDMVNYTLWRTSNYGDGNEIDYANLTGTIAPGALGVIRVNTAGCGPAGTNGTIDNGFNGDDQIQLRNAAGTVVIDDVHTYFDKGYYMVRNTGALSARTTFVASDWSITPLAAGQCWPSAGLVLPSGNGNSPDVTLNPVDVNASCSSSTAILTVAGTEGVAGGAGLAYQWYVNVPGTAGWTAVSNGGVYSGATSATLNISSTSGLNNYQYYCQIREDNATCYTATDAAIIKDGATVWNGSTWSNGVPNSGMLAIIDGNYDTTSHGDFECCSLLVNSGFTLNIQANDYVEIQYNLTNNGTLNVFNNGSLIQVNDLGVNTGNISYQRTAMARNLDYVYWSSPVAAFNVNNLPNNYRYIWNTTIANTNGGQGAWVAASGNMIAGKGYIARASNGSATPIATTTTFNGVPNNGVISIPIQRGSYQGTDYSGTNGITITRFSDNWNLIGNPYPSSINVEDFLNLNTNIEGAVRIWTHGTLPSSTIANPFYGSYQANYTPDDYITHNGVGTDSGPIGFNGFMAGGQGFLVNMLDGAAGSDNVIFNNSLRDKNYDNSQFYRTSNVENASNDKNRIWLDIINSNNAANRTLVGYVRNATNDKDRLYDAVTSVTTTMRLYSVIATDKMTIQGRELPFNPNDKVQLGYYVPATGTFSIGIAAVDGLFAENQNIYLEDTQLGIIHDLKQSVYSFSTDSGEFNDRFVLRYTNETLGGEDFISNESVLVYSNSAITVSSNSSKISAIQIYNVLGQLLFNQSNINASFFEVNVIQKSNQALIVQIQLNDGKKVVKKLIF